MMELVKISLYACGCYSGADYEDNIWIKKSSYEKIKDSIPSEIGCGELDGKFSEVMGDIEVSTNLNSEEDYANEGKLECDGDYLEWELDSIYKKNNLDFYNERKEINNYFDSLDTYEQVIMRVPKSKVSMLKDYAKKLCDKE